MSTSADEKIRPLPEGYPEICADMVSQVEMLLREVGIEPDRAFEIAFRAGEHIREHWGGSMIYIARGAHFDALQWHKEMFEKFSGNNHEQLAKEYKVSVQFVYKIVKMMKATEMARRQTKLF
jgi:Mor family transcriptional regulator